MRTNFRVTVRNNFPLPQDKGGRVDAGSHRLRSRRWWAHDRPVSPGPRPVLAGGGCGVHRAYGSVLPAQPEPVAVLGIDETRRGRPRRRDPDTGLWEVTVDRWHVGFVDIGGRQGLLGQVEGRTARNEDDHHCPNARSLSMHGHRGLLDVRRPPAEDLAAPALSQVRYTSSVLVEHRARRGWSRLAAEIGAATAGPEGPAAAAVWGVPRPGVLSG